MITFVLCNIFEQIWYSESILSHYIIRILTWKMDDLWCLIQNNKNCWYLSHFDWFKTNWCHVLLWVQHHFGPSWTVQNNFGQVPIVLDWFNSFWSGSNHFTLRPSGTLLFSGLPMLILKIFFCVCLHILKSNWKNLWNQSVKKVTQMIWQNFSVLALKNVSKTFKSIWKPNPCMDPLEKKILLYQFLF